MSGGVMLTMAGEYDQQSLNQKSRYFDIFDLKGELKALLEKLNIDNYKLNCYNYKDFYDFKLEYQSKEICYLREFISFQKKYLITFDIDKPVIVARYLDRS